MQVLANTCVSKQSIHPDETLQLFNLASLIAIIQVIVDLNKLIL
jgi:hypothetical protein